MTPGLYVVIGDVAKPAKFSAPMRREDLGQIYRGWKKTTTLDTEFSDTLTWPHADMVLDPATRTVFAEQGQVTITYNEDTQSKGDLYIFLDMSVDGIDYRLTGGLEFLKRVDRRGKIAHFFADALGRKDGATDITLDADTLNRIFSLGVAGMALLHAPREATDKLINLGPAPVTSFTRLAEPTGQKIGTHNATTNAHIWTASPLGSVS